MYNKHLFIYVICDMYFNVYFKCFHKYLTYIYTYLYFRLPFSYLLKHNFSSTVLFTTMNFFRALSVFHS